jgi:hypothetical protein
MNRLIPYYEARYKQQSVGVEGTNLMEWWRQEILVSTGSISWDSIEQFDDTQFHVASASCPGGFFTVIRGLGTAGAGSCIVHLLAFLDLLLFVLPLISVVIDRFSFGSSFLKPIIQSLQVLARIGRRLTINNNRMSFGVAWS